MSSGVRTVADRSDAQWRAVRSRNAVSVLDILVRWGVAQVFCCPGSTEAAVLDAFVGRSDIELVLVTHESVAVSAAEGAARATGRPAVAYLHANVGLANGIAHLSSATNAHLPVVVLNGMKPSPLPARGGFTTSPYPRDAVRQYVKWAWVAESGSSVARHVDRALRTAVSEPAGPVWLGLPQDVMEDGLDTDPVMHPPIASLSPTRLAATRATDDDLAAAATALRSAQRPVIVSGSDVARHNATGQLLSIAERLGAVVLWEGRTDFVRSTVPSTHRLVRGGFSATDPHVAAADLIFFVGARLFVEFQPVANPIPPAAVTIHQHVDQAEVGRLYPVDVPLGGNTDATLAALDDRLCDLPVGAPCWSDRPRFVTSPPPPGRFPAHANLEAILAELSSAIGTHPTTVLDATTATGLLVDALAQSRPDQLHSSTSGSLGWGMGLALGLAMNDRQHPVAVMLGDGAFQFGVQALWTAQRHRLPIAFVVLNNMAYSAVAGALHRFDGAAVDANDWPGVDIAGPDIAAIARGFGLPAVRIDAVRDPAVIGPAIRDAIARTVDGPTLVEIMTASPRTSAEVPRIDV